MTIERDYWLRGPKPQKEVSTKKTWTRPEGRLVLAGTGHRPEDLGGYGDDVFNELVKLADYGLKKATPDLVISGMAQGWDMALAQACVDLGIPFHAYVPFEGQEARWAFSGQQRYHRLLHQAEKVLYICSPGFAGWKMQQRNEAMVDAAGVVLALFNPGKTSGGTFNCVQYARGKVQILNLWTTWTNRAY